jgi:hypothetical protein
MSEPVLPLVVRIERTRPPTRTDALEAAARGVLLMLIDDRDGWRDAISAWDGRRIRKVVRRARGAEWQRVLNLDGLTVSQQTAQVRTPGRVTWRDCRLEARNCRIRSPRRR